MLLHVAWHIPRATLHMHVVSRSQVDWDVYANWHCFLHVLLLTYTHCASAMQSAALSFNEQRRLH
jgi:hypothetical protein